MLEAFVMFTLHQKHQIPSRASNSQTRLSMSCYHLIKLHETAGKQSRRAVYMVSLLSKCIASTEQLPISCHASPQRICLSPLSNPSKSIHAYACAQRLHLPILTFAWLSVRQHRSKNEARIRKAKLNIFVFRKD